MARSLARVTGETMTEAIITALRERLVREQAAREAAATLTTRLMALKAKLRANYDTRTLTRAEWDAASGDAL